MAEVQKKKRDVAMGNGVLVYHKTLKHESGDDKGKPKTKVVSAKVAAGKMANWTTTPPK